MKRWDISQMLDIGRKLFAKIHKQKKHVGHNNEIHVMAREIEEWLPQGIQYSPTQTENISKVTPKNDVQYLDEMGGGWQLLNIKITWF